MAATLYTFWRNQTVRNVIDATLTRVGLSSQLPGNEETLRAIKNLLDTFPTARGKGASGLDFFVVSGAPNPEAARDFLLLKSLKDGLTLLASDEFAPAYAQSDQSGRVPLGQVAPQGVPSPAGRAVQHSGQQSVPDHQPGGQPAGRGAPGQLRSG
ncbi:MAG: hypothetical protein IPO66_20280 [Rhodanobacteraceae bacterium]|nr:hypothetical protein [Rhodanobacteraceae bacterium]